MIPLPATDLSFTLAKAGSVPSPFEVGGRNLLNTALSVRNDKYHELIRKRIMRIAWQVNI